jgi:N-acetylneuraminic acid mutarotase
MLRSGLWFVLGISWLTNSFASSPDPALDRDLGRLVEAMRVVDQLYFRYQTPAIGRFEDALPYQATVERARRTLRYATALENQFGIDVTPERLQLELQRIARDTRFPQRLGEIYAALDHDPQLVIEALVRPQWVTRQIQRAFAQDPQIHRESRRRIELLYGEASQSHATAPVFAEHVRRIVLRPQTQGQTPHQAIHEGASWPLDADQFAARLKAARSSPAVGPIQEDEQRFWFERTLNSTPTEIEIALYEVPKQSFESWWQRVADQFEPNAAPLLRVNADLPKPHGGPDQPELFESAACGLDDLWDNGRLDDVPLGREQHASIWTGAHLFVWGGLINFTGARLFQSGHRYDPVTDTWIRMTEVGAPQARYQHRMVWTGSRLVVWGGVGLLPSGFYGVLNNGGRYDPFNDVWYGLSTTNAPVGRHGFSQIWTGTRMLVWGGFDGSNFRDDGGSYDPVADAWSPMSTDNAPSARYGHSAIWAPSPKRMVIWGGDGDDGLLSTGGVYNFTTNSWSPTSNTGAPQARSLHSAIWTGVEMIIWGGYGVRRTDPNPQVLDTGAKYNPSTSTWTGATSMVGQPSSRANHTGVWAGTRMIVWGGENVAGPVANGGIYDPGTNSWTPMSEVNAPSARSEHTGVWTGSEMIIWGGSGIQPWGAGGWPITGARYRVATDTWTPMSTGEAPEGRTEHVAQWTGNRVLIWGGRRQSQLFGSGAAYDPLLDAWFSISNTGAPTPRYQSGQVWTGQQLLVWGGLDAEGTVGDGRRYDPNVDQWLPLSDAGAPSPRQAFSTVWSGNEMLIWGGTDTLHNLSYADGARYAPASDSWTAITTTAAPTPRWSHSGVWTGSRLLIWGGWNISAQGTGASYDPLTDSWTPITMTGAPQARGYHNTLWTGREMVIWGGDVGFGVPPTTHSRYRPENDAWYAINLSGAPEPSYGQSLTWTGTRMVVWSAPRSDGAATGGQYDPITNQWTTMTSEGAPAQRWSHTATWIGGRIFVFGGYNGDYPKQAGLYGHDLDGDGAGESCDCAATDAGATQLPEEIAALTLPDLSSLRWESARWSAGPATTHDVISGSIATLPNFDLPAASCLASQLPGDALTVAANPPSGAAVWYLVRGHNSCGPGTYGRSSSASERISTACP